MTNKELHRNVLDSLVRGDSVLYCTICPGEIGISFDRYRAFWLPEKYCYLDTTKLKANDNLRKYFSVTEEDKPLKLTKRLLADQMDSLRRLDGENFSVWISQNFLRGYEGYEYQLYGASPKDVVKVVSIVTGKVVAALCPKLVSKED